MNAPSNIAQDQRDDFYNALPALGYAAEQFELRATEQIPGGPGPVTATVFVKRTVGGDSLERHYEAGHGTAWVVKALDDVKSGDFGQPR